MKKMFFLLIAATEALSAGAQTAGQAAQPLAPVPVGYCTDEFLSRWVLDINFRGGTLSQDVNTAVSATNYADAVSSKTNLGTADFKGKYTLGVDGQLGFFFGNKRHWGLGAGFMYLGQRAESSLDQYHVEYRSTDVNGNVFRQLVTGNNIKETVKITNLNIPIVLKYKTRFSKALGFTADAGILINTSIKNKYTTEANFDYEAVYNYGTNGTSTYDGNNPALPSSVLYTRESYQAHNPNGDVQTWFKNLNERGYNVGLGQTPTAKEGEVSYKTGDVGFIVSPALSIFLSDNVAVNVGAYYIYQSFENTPTTGYQLTSKIGDYSSMQNTVSSSTNQSFGGNVGLRFFFGKRAAPLTISSVDMTNPTYCGVCDGTFTLNGLWPAKEVTVSYNMNGTPQPPYKGTVGADGKVKVSNLCAGNYTEVTATIGRKHASTMPINLVNPPLNISQRSSDPTANGACDGSITLGGLRAGEAVAVSYTYNGRQTPYNGTAASDNTVKLTGLCDGRYSNITIATKGCTANGRDMTLTAPPPPPPPPPPPVVEISMTTPILFEVNKTNIDPVSFPVLDVAVREMKKDPKAIVVIEGYTDNTGTVAYNKKLSVRRAVAVRKELIKRGGTGKNIKSIGYGPKNPVATNSTPEGRKLNRRVIMRLKVM
jgi:outer membrane protein OmpA-like peptidoglycan-associated protein